MNVVVEGGEVDAETESCIDALFVNVTLFPSLFVGQYRQLFGAAGIINATLY